MKVKDFNNLLRFSPACKASYVGLFDNEVVVFNKINSIQEMQHVISQYDRAWFETASPSEIIADVVQSLRKYYGFGNILKIGNIDCGCILELDYNHLDKLYYTACENSVKQNQYLATDQYIGFDEFTKEALGLGEEIKGGDEKLLPTLLDLIARKIGTK